MSETLDEEKARVVLPEPVKLLERYEATSLVERTGPRISRIGIGRAERLDLEVLDPA
jgi:hypothetical protein